MYYRNYYERPHAQYIVVNLIMSSPPHTRRSSLASRMRFGATDAHFVRARSQIYAYGDINAITYV